ncbi:DNA repair protein RecO [Corynebacterium sp. UMB10321]|uniref:DNA repair protein RecO n=1 Tax=Corynebacterium sp. UMB10321 TaxID=3046312 RepID=UPI00254A383B|nr:DNA repair protein RecO [Corynebacterium sp. UMB10321]MDK8244829.1 DNA repair protein RecO [Corynebacterium sp. UMB10321]
MASRRGRGAGRPSWRDRAFVVRTYDFGEADRVVVLLTRDHGLVRGVAKGVRKARSRFGSRLQPFVEVDVQVYPGRGLSTITSADTVAFYGHAIIDDFDRYAAGCAMLEAAEKLSFDQEDPELFALLQEGFERLQSPTHPTLVLDAFLLKAAAHAGWKMSLFNCANCQAPGPHKAFHAGTGGAVCTLCRPPGAMDVDPEVLHSMWLLEHDHVCSEEFAEQVHRATSAHLQFYLGAGLTSLRVMKQA